MELNDVSTFPHCFVECGEGWYPLISRVEKEILEYNKTVPLEEDKIFFTQVKEKFGLLRIYVSYGTDDLYKVIDEVEAESAKVCESCGSRDNVALRGNSWLYTGCDECEKLGL